MKSTTQIPQFMEMSQLIKIQQKRNTLSYVSAELALNRVFQFFFFGDISMRFVLRLVKPGLFTVNYARCLFILLFMFISLSQFYHF